MTSNETTDDAMAQLIRDARDEERERCKTIIRAKLMGTALGRDAIVQIERDVNMTKPLAAVALALLLSGCAGSAAFGPGLSAKEQLLQEVLSAPTAICTALQLQNIQAALQLKAILTAPTVSLPVAMMTPTPVSLPSPAPPPIVTTPLPPITAPAPVPVPAFR